MGKKAKEHRKKVAARNQRISIAKKKFEKEYQKMVSERIEEMKQQFAAMSGETGLLDGENVDIVDEVTEVVETKEQPTEDTAEQE